MPRTALAYHPYPADAIAGKGALFSCLERHLGLVIPGVLTEAECAAMAGAVYAARAHWTEDFGGEQFSFGRAFYTHLEQDRCREYFAGASASDALVERYLPGMQARMRAILCMLTGGEVRARHGFCGPGVHVFPSGAEVAERGGVVHFDTEGLSAHHLRGALRALTLVLMLQPPEQGGGLRLWDVRYSGRDEPTSVELEAPSLIAAYEVGSVLVLDSYRLHQIQPFSGTRDRISITAHAAETDEDLWDVWF